jgi:hypothetical protein
MVANIFSEEYIFFSDFLNHIFLLGIVLKKRRANLSDVAKERVKHIDKSYKFHISIVKRVGERNISDFISILLISNGLLVSSSFESFLLAGCSVELFREYCET